MNTKFSLKCAYRFKGIGFWVGLNKKTRPYLDIETDYVCRKHISYILFMYLHFFFLNVHFLSSLDYEFQIASWIDSDM